MGAFLYEVRNAVILASYRMSKELSPHINMREYELREYMREEMEKVMAKAFENIQKRRNG